MSEVRGRTRECRHDTRTPPFAFTRRLVAFCCAYAVAVTVAALVWPLAAEKAVPVIGG
jgi:hypothetical protein